MTKISKKQLIEMVNADQKINTKDNFPESVKQSVAMVELVQGKGAVSDFAIEQSTLAATGAISFDDAVKANIEHK